MLLAVVLNPALLVLRIFHHLRFLRVSGTLIVHRTYCTLYTLIVLVVQIGDVTDRRRIPADNVVYGGDDVVQLPLGDAPVPVDVVQLEDPAETVRTRSPAAASIG